MLPRTGNTPPGRALGICGCEQSTMIRTENTTELTQHAVVHAPTVSVLCASRRSVYKRLEGVDVYDIDRDCYTFDGSTPVVAHPPCRAWSARLRHQAKPPAGEKDIAPWCVEQLRQCGGVLEHPAKSVLWDELSLPKPGCRRRDNLWSMELNQSWFGYTIAKRTWVLVSMVDQPPEIPFRLHYSHGDSKRFKAMSRNARAATPIDFAKWLVATARLVGA